MSSSLSAGRRSSRNGNFYGSAEPSAINVVQVCKADVDVLRQLLSECEVGHTKKIHWSGIAAPGCLSPGAPRPFQSSACSWRSLEVIRIVSVHFHGGTALLPVF